MTALEPDLSDMKAGSPAPLFLLSFLHRDALIAMAEAGGWLPIAARRAVGVEARFLRSGAAVAVVDARGALQQAHDAVRALRDVTEANAATLLVLVDQADQTALASFFEDGATHFLLAPWNPEELLLSLRFAQRHADRVAGRYRSLQRPGEKPGASGASWRWEPGSATIDLSPALARKAGFGENGGQRIPLIELLRRLDSEGRRAARVAIDRLLATGEATAFAHQDSEEGSRLAHHVRVEKGAGAIVGRTETISANDGDDYQSRDLLTGVRDAHAARAWLDHQLATEEGRQSTVVLLLAATRFDAINSAFGRATGDAVLQAAARRIERLVDADNKRRLVARVAGAQFAILLAAPTSLNEGRYLAFQLVDALARPFVSGDHAITLGSRAGVAIASPGDTAADLLRRASEALIEAKAGDSAAVRVIDAGVRSRGDRLEVDLRRALDGDEIDILFQPQVAVTSGRIVGVEALARWRHPEFGELGATTLFSVAERSDYLVQLSDHVQRKALGAAAAWPPGLAGLRLAVNITAGDIARSGFATHFLDLVQTTGFDPDRLTVEVTENGLIEDLSAAGTLLAQLREGGLRIAIDDFGTGYSSLAYLKALPLDYLKIDKRLSEDIIGSSRDRIVVRSVIDMARSLGLGVIAEGVETQEQLDLLAQEGCTLYQGYLCSEPIGSAALAALVADGG